MTELVTIINEVYVCSVIYSKGTLPKFCQNANTLRKKNNNKETKTTKFWGKWKHFGLNSVANMTQQQTVLGFCFLPPLYSLMASDKASMDSISRLLVGSSCWKETQWWESILLVGKWSKVQVQLYQDENIRLATGEFSKHHSGFLATWHTHTQFTHTINNNNEDICVLQQWFSTGGGSTPILVSSPSINGRK